MASAGSTLLLWLLLLLQSVAISTASSRGIRVELKHADTRGDFTGTERIRRAAERSHRRVNGLLDTGISSTATLKGDGIEGTATVHASTATYLVDLAIGTPPLPITAVLDTGSDLIWTQCDAPCRKCFPQPAPLYAPAGSATYANVSCRSPLCDALRVDPSSHCSAAERGCPYYFSYGDGTSTNGVLATETLTFESGAAVHGIAFGCGTENHGSTDNSSGLVGMGRGPLSLVSQLGVTRFSYCFTPFNDKTASPLFLGPSAAALSTAAKSTPFAPNPSGGGRTSSYYYLNLEGISVDDTLLPIDPVVFQVSPMGGGGFIIDSGTTFTALEERAFLVLARAFAARVGLPLASGAHLGLSLCFAAPEGRTEAVDVPRLVFHFDGADMALPRESYVVEDRSTGVACLGMVSMRGMSVLGSLQQQSMHVLYDLEGILSFEHAKCGEL
ncbi:hypothetical protein QYE76_040838 [Lolium multiflorum]|uniref:Peptidase A1 domain-containing protein n=1 Tax=Lolium multiflorum TaxID=4521 RepID=A0AAD8TCC4_LOLMU|nr:hypothetical protein QYE76_040838 [Lolium multiflorum]